MRPTDVRPNLDELRAQLVDPLARALRMEASTLALAPLGDAPLVVDGTTKLVVRDRNARAVAVVLCSPPSTPGIVARGADRARAARAALGPELGRAVIETLAEGSISGASWVALPFCRPLPNARIAWWIRRPSVRAGLLAWLRDTAAATVSDATAHEVESMYRAPLRRLVESADADALADDARNALERLDAGVWRPRVVLMHGDLWKANVLAREGASAGEFVLIDWPASAVRGHAIYDLARMSNSFACRGARLRSELEAHCRVLGCEPAEARAHLAAALGHVALHIENFPADLYRRMVASCVAALEGAGLPRLRRASSG